MLPHIAIIFYASCMLNIKSITLGNDTHKSWLVRDDSFCIGYVECKKIKDYNEEPIYRSVNDERYGCYDMGFYDVNNNFNVCIDKEFGSCKGE